MYKRCTSTCFAVYTLVYTLIYTHTRQSRSSWVAPDESGQVKIGLVKMPDDADMFDMDTDHASSVPSKDRHAETQSQAASSSCGELSSAVDCALDRRGSIDLCRRAVPVIVAEADDICSICLDEFTQEDPGMATVCGHQYHLQCIMQWAQRSRECPMCFKGLQLQDPGMQELLPFGEYVSPEQTQSAQNLFMGQFEAWELERILARLAVSNGGPGLNTGRRRGQPRAEPVNVERPGADAGSSSGPQSGAPSDQAAVSDGFLDEASYPSSWPPNSARGKPQASARRPRNISPVDMHRQSVTGDPLKNVTESFKSRWSAVSSKCKEFSSRFSRQTNARWAGRDQQDSSTDADTSSSAA